SHPGAGERSPPLGRGHRAHRMDQPQCALAGHRRRRPGRDVRDEGASALTLAAPQAFFGSVRAGLLGPTLSDGEVSGCNAVLGALATWPAAWAAYGLATAYHET